MISRNKLILSFLLSVALFYVVVIAVPVTFLTGNYEAIGLELSDIRYLVYNFILVVPIAALITILCSRTLFFNGFLYILISTILVISIAFPNKTGFLDGIRDSAVFSFSYDVLWDLGKFFFLFCLFSILYKKHQANFKFVSYLLLIASLGQLSYLIFELQQREYSSKSTLRLASLSTRENTIIISFDGLQGDVVEDIISKTPELAGGLSGFKFYPNVSSGAPNTVRSNFITMLGKVPPLESSTRQWFAVYSKDVLPHVLSEQAGYDATTYITGVPCSDVNKRWECYGQGSFFKQYGEYGDSVSKSSIYLYAMMRIMPAFMAQALYESVFDYENVTKQKNFFTLASEDTGKHRFGRTYFELLTFIDNLEIIEKAPSFIFHHYIFSHQPSTFDQECNYRMSSSVEQNMDAARAEAKCALKMMNRIVNRLKDIGGYDNSLVFFISDHGLEANMNGIPVDKGDFEYRGNTINYKGYSSVSRYNPILFYKDFSSSGDIEVIHDDVSLVDIFPTICRKIHIQDYCSRLNLDGVDLDNSHVKRVKKFLMFKGGSENISVFFENLELFEIVSFSGDVRKELQALFESTYPGSYFFNSLDLHHQVGVLSSSSIKADSESSSSGFLSYGPYISLPQGEYKVTIRYDSLSSSDKKVGWWDVVSNRGKKKFLRQKIFGSEGERGILNATFHSDGLTRDFEFRVFFAGEGDLQLHGIQVDKID